MKKIPTKLKSVSEVYYGSNSADTARVMRELQRRPGGLIAVLLFRAQKASSRAKKYKGGIKDGPSYRNLAYQKKDECIGNLCMALMEQSEFTWGWGLDDKVSSGSGPKHVLYVDLPTGQVSFHNYAKYKGPDYSGEWDGVRGASEDRILEFCTSVMEQSPD
jgi:hypothetical protein